MILTIALAAAMLVVTSAMHAGGMLIILRTFWESRPGTRDRVNRVLWVGGVVIVMFLVSVAEAAVWAAVYVMAGAIEGAERALYFSMVTFTTLGYGDIVLGEDARLLAATQSAAGIIMFGWTTAIVIAAVQHLFLGADLAALSESARSRLVPTAAPEMPIRPAPSKQRPGSNEMEQHMQPTSAARSHPGGQVDIDPAADALRRRKLSLFGVPLLVGMLMLGGPVDAQEQSTSSEDLAKAAQNPLASLVTLPLQANYNLGTGPYERTFFNLNVQPVIPFPGDKWNVIARTIIPINSLPMGKTDSSFGIGDTTMTLFFSPAKGGNLTWGAGPVIGLPSASNPELLGSGKWGLGPSGVLFFMTGKWTMGAVASNTWSIAGNSDRPDYSRFVAQWFLNYNFGGGWAVGTAPIVTADWKASPGNKWTVPLGLQISKVTRFGNRPVNLLLGYYANVERPEGAPDSQVRVQLNFMFPTSR